MWPTILIVLFIIVVFSIKQINQYERGVKFTLGKFTSMMEPGWRLVWPVFQTYQKVLNFLLNGLIQRIFLNRLHYESHLNWICVDE